MAAEVVASPPVFLDSLPSWASELVRAANAKQANTFVIHGVPADLVPVRGSAGLRFLSLDDFLVQQLFSGWQSIITYNRAEGLGFATPGARSHFQAFLKGYDAVHGTSWMDGLPRDAPNCFALLDSYYLQCASCQPARPVVLLLPFAETIVPAAEVAYRTPEDRAVLVYLRKWSQDPVLLAKNIVVVLVTESLAELDQKLVRAHSTREIEIMRPDQAERLTYLEAVRSPDWYAKKSDLPPQRLAELTAGMTRVQLGQLLEGADANGDHLTRERVRAMKKEVIETEGLGLLEYVEPKFDLSMVAGMPAVKDRLRRAARAIARGNPAAVPMGYLDLRPGGERQDFPRRVLRQRDRLSLREAQELPLHVGGIDGVQSGADLEDPRLLDSRGRGGGRGRRRSGQPRAAGGFGHPEPRLRPDRRLHGRHPLPRQDPLVFDHRPAGPAAH